MSVIIVQHLNTLAKCYLKCFIPPHRYTISKHVTLYCRAWQIICDTKLCNYTVYCTKVMCAINRWWRFIPFRVWLSCDFVHFTRTTSIAPSLSASYTINIHFTINESYKIVHTFSMEFKTEIVHAISSGYPYTILG